ncbi:MAG: hypothetical protein JWN41_507 [Thermoleophilia bacterium]|nr:hypothetical protein [Thermoleophilia bacterium]
MDSNLAFADPKTPPTDHATPEDASLEPRLHCDAVDHEREHGVPPESNDDYASDEVDHEGADSFPASDPPGGW